MTIVDAARLEELQRLILWIASKPTMIDRWDITHYATERMLEIREAEYKERTA